MDGSCVLDLGKSIGQLCAGNNQISVFGRVVYLNTLIKLDSKVIRFKNEIIIFFINEGIMCALDTKIIFT